MATLKLVKHPELGNKHVPESEVKGLVANGWQVWPRTKEQKEGTPADPAEQAEQADKPRRGRPPKAREPAEEETVFAPPLGVRAEEPPHRQEL